MVRQALHARFERCGDDLLATAQVLHEGSSSVMTCLSLGLSLVQHQGLF